jgi:outer membrane receptor protein involved in Fe transport
LPDEVLIKSDTTTNYELGMHTQFGDSVIFNSALFYIDWDDIQVADVTQNGAIPITSNGGSARSMGIEMSGQWYITQDLSVLGSYAYTDAELTDDAPGLVNGADAFDGDRLPGTPEHQGFLAVNYALSIGDGSQIDFDWSMTATSDVITKVGERDFGESLDGFTLHNVSATWFKDSWRIALYADNVFDEYAETGVRADPSFIRPVGDFDLRRYYHNVVRPRQVGMRFTYNFDG